MKKISICTALILILSQSILAQNEFTHYIPNALAIGYGGSSVAHTDNPAIVYWNPGGIAFATNDKILMNLTSHSSFNYISFTKFFPPQNAIGFSISRLMKDDKFLDIGTAAYSRRINHFFSIGANINYSKYNENGDYSVTGSIGILLKPALNRYSFYQTSLSPFSLFINPSMYDKFSLGIMVHNIPLDKSSTLHEVRIGSEFKFSNWGPIFNLGYHIHHSKGNTHLGVGIKLISFFSIYSGLTDFNTNNSALGGSILFKSITADIAYSTQTEKLTISLSMRFNEETRHLAKRFVEQGTKKIRDNDLRGALLEYEKSLAYDQNNERIIYLTNILNKRIQTENMKIDSLFSEAALFQKKGWIIYAVVTYKKILEIDKNNNKAKKCIKELQQDLAQNIYWLYEEGKRDLQNKKWEDAKNKFAYILLANENHQGALSCLAKIDSISSYLSNDYYYRGLGYYQQRRLEKSKVAFQQVLEINPRHKEAKYYLDKINQEIKANKQVIEKLFDEATTLERQGSYLLASTKYREILNINRDHEKAARQLDLLDSYVSIIINRKFEKAKRLFEKGKYDEAQAAFKEILSIEPNHKQARNYQKRVREILTDKIDSHYQLVKQYADYKMWREALREIEQVLSIDPNHSDAIKIQHEIQTQITLEDLQENGLKLFNKGEYLGALQSFNQILEKNPNHVIAKSYITECRVKLNKRISELFNSGMRFYTGGNYEAAIREWNRILEIDPLNESALEYKKRARERLEALKRLQ